MPTKVVISQDPTFESENILGGEDHGLLSNTVDSNLVDDTGLGGEGRAPKRFQKSMSDRTFAFRRPTNGSSSISNAESHETKPLADSRRRQSVRDTKPMQVLNTLQHSPSKRSAHYTSQRSAATTNTREPSSRQAPTNRKPSFQFEATVPAPQDDTHDLSETFEFLPSVNFDEFHASLTGKESGFSLHQAPNDHSSEAVSESSTLKGNDRSTETKIPLKSAGTSDSGLRIGRSGSLLRRHNSQTKPNISRGTDGESSLAPVELAASKSRRMSQFPTTPSSTYITNMARSPRKSVGPGVLAQDISSNNISLPGASHLELNGGELDVALAPSLPRGIAEVPKTQLRSRDASFASAASARQKKTKSLHIPSKSIEDPFSNAYGTPDTTTSSIGNSRSAGRPLGQRTITPTSNKRMSVMPNSAHATGLAARTISPTDARRLKRMSVMPNPPPMPHTPPTPQPERPFLKDASVNSPPLPRKDLTPTSSRTSPEPHRKSYSSGVSNSSTTSYNSCQSLNGPARMSQSLSTSRLPTLKTRNEPIPAGGEEEVPPVPAIPKAYESPQAEIDQPFFSVRKPSLPYDASNLASASTADGAPTPSSDMETPALPRKSSLKKPPANDVNEAARRKGISVVNNNRRTLQPLRLPPLNLLPLSTPTAAKINALYDGTSSNNIGTITPPPKPRRAATPTTPMTASRASFFAKSQQSQDPLPSRTQIRSSSSHYAVGPDTSAHRETEASSFAMIAKHENHDRKTVSPFTSTSLPKTSGDFGYLRSISGHHTVDAKPEGRTGRLTGPRSQKSRKASKEEISGAETSSSVDVSSFGTSLRRKLSLTRKRSTSKSQSRAGSEDEAPPKPPKHDHMPPPKLPASATWSGPLLPSPSPTQRNKQLPTRKKSSKPTTPQHERNRSSTWTNSVTPKKDSIVTDRAAAIASSKRTLRSTLEGSYSSNNISLKDLLKEPKIMENQLDRDDRQAEEEMKKLASNRKDAEVAAREMDALRRRATAKDRTSPNQALLDFNLNIFERGEIVDYSSIYFCGTSDAKKHVGDLNAETANFGYDDERGDYNIMIGDHLAYRYEMIDILGKGSFGQVVRCVDHKTGGLVAIKIIRNKKRFHQQALVEVDILQKLREWVSVFVQTCVRATNYFQDPHKKHSMVEFTQSFYFRGHLCISTELLGMNLYEFIKCHDFRGFSLKLIRRFAKQLLSSLVLLKSHKVIHCDLKPENILLAHPARSEIKVIDFGSSCMENEKVYTYIQSRFYRSPEVILGMTYGMPIDMWSLGCILAELLTGYPIFPGENEQEQLACIMEVFGPPEKHLIEKSTRKKLFFDSLGKPRLNVSSKGKRRRPSSKTLQQALKCEDEAFLDFITRCLRWDPDRRLKPDEATRHEFISGVKAVARPVARSQAPSVSNSPVKRYNSMATPAVIRPLPEPPATSFKNGTAVRNNREMPSASPSKPTAGTQKRHSTISGPLPTSSAGVKRALNGTAVTGSALPRVTQRSMSGKSDLAAAAAVASLNRISEPPGADQH
ncbi:MAG: hypothetical protein Q9190_000552 [Brigantiaea leucoxantha]